MSEALYDRIGSGYSRYRQPDPRVAARILAALDPAQSIVNVGAGTGSYEPRDRQVIAVEPSGAMVRQRQRRANALMLRASAEHLPLRGGSADAAIAILTIHHWQDWRAGLREMRRVARDRIVVLTWDPSHPGFWLTSEYFPEILSIDRRIFPSLEELAECIGAGEAEVLPIPNDCKDGFLGAYWQRPERYLDPEVRAAISTFSKLREVDAGIAELARDLKSGAWQRRHEELLPMKELDLGYRILVAPGSRRHGLTPQ
jgi:SAM-dependent methyltransferase